MDAFDRGGTFNEDYLWFYEPELGAERNRQEAAEIVTALQIDTPTSILDAPCGHGRIANLLACEGHTVTGVDATPEFLERARSDARGLGVDVDYRLGDLRDLPVDGHFDAVVCWFTSFGYFDDVGNRRTLEEFARVLAPGGKLLIETLHHDGFLRAFTPAPAATVTQRGDDIMVDVRTFDSLHGRVETDRAVHREGLIRRSHHSIRLPTVPEFDHWLTAAGFSDCSYRDRGGRELRYDSWRVVITATKR